MHLMAERCLPIGVSIPESLLAKIDRERAGKPRSRFVVELLAKALK